MSSITRNDERWTDEQQALVDGIRQREVLAYLQGVNSVIRRTPLDWTESEAQHALKSILTCVVATFHLKVKDGPLDNAWIDCIDEGIELLLEDEGLSL
jgi:hypothetical protein